MLSGEADQMAFARALAFAHSYEVNTRLEQIRTRLVPGFYNIGTKLAARRLPTGCPKTSGGLPEGFPRTLEGLKTAASRKRASPPRNRDDIRRR